MKKSAQYAVIVLSAAMVTPSVMATDLFGIDVSSYQGSINWSSVHSSGAAFAYVHATTGDAMKDADFAMNMSNGKSAGLQMGAYDDAKPATDTPLQDATYFWNDASSEIKADGKSIMPALVMGFGGHDGASSYTQWANEWSADIIADGHTAGVTLRPVILCSAGTGACDLTTNIALAAWIANYNGENLYTGNPWSCCTSCNVWDPGTNGKWTFWQVSSTGVLGGISGDVDFDAYNGTLADLIAYEGVTSY